MEDGRKVEREEYRRVRVLIFPPTKFTNNLSSLFTKDLSALTFTQMHSGENVIVNRSASGGLAPAGATQQRPLWSVPQLVKASGLWEFWSITALLRL